MLTLRAVTQQNIMPLTENNYANTFMYNILKTTTILHGTSTTEPSTERDPTTPITVPPAARATLPSDSMFGM